MKFLTATESAWGQNHRQAKERLQEATTSHRYSKSRGADSGAEENAENSGWRRDMIGRLRTKQPDDDDGEKQNKETYLDHGRL